MSKITESQVTKYTDSEGTEYFSKEEAEFSQAQIDIATYLEKQDFAYGELYSTSICTSDLVIMIGVSKILKKYNQIK